MLAEAEALADRCKWHVFPLHGISTDGTCTCGNPSCASPGKHPADGLPWKSAATTDALTVVRWFGSESNRNVGIHLRPSGLAVVDIDGEAAVDRFRALFGKGVTSPLVVRTGRDESGWHLYFSAEGLGVPKVARDGIELRVGDHYVVAPPSRHASGREYTWYRGDPVKEAGSLPLVPDLFREWAATCATPINAKAVRVVARDRIVKGGRRDYLFRWACSLRDKGLGGDDLLDHLSILNQKCEPPLPDDELQTIAVSVTKRYTPKHAITPSDWVEPLPLDVDLEASEPFPVDAAYNAAYADATFKAADDDANNTAYDAATFKAAADDNAAYDNAAYDNAAYDDDDYDDDDAAYDDYDDYDYAAAYDDFYSSYYYYYYCVAYSDEETDT